MGLQQSQHVHCPAVQLSARWRVPTALLLCHQTAFSFLARMARPAGMDDLKDVMRRWQPWTPPRNDQALQQGGMFVFRGAACVWSRFDAATGDHADLDTVLGVATQLGQLADAAADCGCEPARPQE